MAVQKRALLLHQKTEVPLPSAATVNDEAIQRENEQLVTQTKIKVQEFLAGAELYTLRVQY